MNKETKCEWCERGDKPEYLDGDGVKCSISGNAGKLSHALDDSWWECPKGAASVNKTVACNLVDFREKFARRIAEDDEWKWRVEDLFVKLGLEGKTETIWQLSQAGIDKIVNVALEVLDFDFHSTVHEAARQFKHDPYCDCGICELCEGQEDVYGNKYPARTVATQNCTWCRGAIYTARAITLNGEPGKIFCSESHREMYINKWDYRPATEKRSTADQSVLKEISEFQLGLKNIRDKLLSPSPLPPPGAMKKNVWLDERRVELAVAVLNRISFEQKYPAEKNPQLLLEWIDELRSLADEKGGDELKIKITINNTVSDKIISGVKKSNSKIFVQTRNCVDCKNVFKVSDPEFSFLALRCKSCLRIKEENQANRC